MAKNLITLSAWHKRLKPKTNVVRYTHLDTIIASQDKIQNLYSIITSSVQLASISRYKQPTSIGTDGQDL